MNQFPVELKFNKYTVIYNYRHGAKPYHTIYLSTDSLFLAKEEMADRERDYCPYEDIGVLQIVEDYNTNGARVIEAYT